MSNLKWFNVLVTLDNDKFYDSVEAENEQQALKVAHYNWEYAENIELISNKK